MPTYMFYCEHCESEKQVTAMLSEELEPPYCNNCEQDMVRQFGVGAVKFNGGGWGKDA